MDYGGRTVMSLESAVSRGIGAIGHIGEKHPGAEIDTLFQDRWGFSAKIGTKSAGFFPGLPIANGAYVGFGLRGVW